jgi:dGTPase
MKWKDLLSTKRVAELFDQPPSTGDSRTEFERDYGRVLFSTPLRRMQDKTQVFPLEQHDSVRTRLTHSLEVSSVSRSLGKLVSQWLEGRKVFSRQDAADVETIAATCGLLHDMGNPPFGHSGEKAIQDWFYQRTEGPRKDDPLGRLNKKSGLAPQCRNDLLRFEGNAQTIRLLSTLQLVSYQQRYVDYGLNLTCATFSAACKYVAPSHKLDKTSGNQQRDHAREKPGYFASENPVIDAVRNTTGTEQHRHPITFLVEACDDLVYCTGDLEDAVKKRLLTWEELKADLHECSGRDRLVAQTIGEAERKVDYKVSDRWTRNEEVTQAFRTHTMNRIKASSLKTFQKNYEAIMEGEYKHELARDPDCESVNLLNACQAVLRRRIFPLQEVIQIELMGRYVIHDLMDAFWEAASTAQPGSLMEPDSKSFTGKLLRLVSKNYRLALERALKEGYLPEDYCRLQLVTDQVSGMTDTFACTLNRNLRNG